MQTGDTIIAQATPAGEGATGVIRLSGSDAISIVNGVFKGRNLETVEGHTLHFGRIYEENRLLDEVVVSIYKAPRSYTKENIVEISCHGSPYILQGVMSLLMAKGARLAQPGEFTMRAFLNGQMDLSQAEAVADLIASESETAHRVAMHQMRGGFKKDITELRQKLIDFASLIELELDFSEEDVEFANRIELRKLILSIQSFIQSLMQSFKLGNAIKQGVHTVIAGRPNAGKSTLLNALLNEERAIVSDIAGTTRDTIEEMLNINGVKFRLIDTAGIREANDAIEAIGVEKTLEKIRQSSLLVYVFDVVSTSPAQLQADLQKLYHEGLHILVVANKMDLNPYTTVEHYQHITEGLETGNSLVNDTNWIPISASNKMNLNFLREKLFEIATDGALTPDHTIVTNARHFEALRQSNESLSDVLTGMDSAVSSDFIAMDIRKALFHLGEITGEISTEDLLDNIFSRFCIGK